jgi:GT2 family glycosyltransferase
MLSGACILLKREVLERLGGFDERFHMYAEDNELCLRILRAGWEIVFEPSAVVIHHGAKSALARWSSLERQIRILNEYLRFQKCSLTRPQFVLNLLANSLVLSLAWAWKGVTAKPTSEVRMKLSLCGKHLREVLFAGNSQRFDRAEQEPSEDHLRKD